VPDKKEKLPLSVTHPELAKEADGWDPAQFTPGSNKKMGWKCTESHTWAAPIYSRVQGNGCPVCAGRKVLAGFNDLATTHPEISKQALNWDPSQFSKGSHQLKEWKCPLGHIWKARIFERSEGNGCPVCVGRKILIGFNDLLSQYPEIASEAFGWEPSKISKGSGKKLQWKCREGHKWLAIVGDRVSGTGCPYCIGKRVVVGKSDLKSTHPELARELVYFHSNDVSAGSNKKLVWECSLGHQWEATVFSRADGRGCPYCGGKKVLSGFNDLLTLNPHLAKQAHNWNPSTVTVSSSKRREWICRESHIWKASIANRSKGENCPYCSGNKVQIGFNDLNTTNPMLAQQAYGWNPETLSAGSSSKRKWICSESHIWTAAVKSRARGRGCPSCAQTGFDPNSEGFLYFLTHQDWGMNQIGITNSPDDRLARHRKLRWEVIELRGPMDGHLTQQWETAILRMLKAKGADLSNEKIAGKFDGYSEAWSKSTFEVKSIKELMRLTEEFEERN
jgi:hypothetical protein